MIVSIVVAMGRNREIGVDNGLPWTLKDDLKNFKKYTMGKPIAMGRNTFESIGRPLPGRENIVLTRNRHWSFEGVRVVHIIDELFSYCESKEFPELAIIGGDKIYSQLIERVDVLYLTEVDGEFPRADAFFPKFNESEWKLFESFHHDKDDRNNYPWTFKVLKRS